MKFEDFLPRVLPWASNCPESVALQHIVDAARMFCVRTLVWNYECDPIESAAGVDRYALQIGDGQELVRVMQVHVGPCGYAVRRGTTARSAVRRQCSSEFAFMDGPLTLCLNPAPSADGAEIRADIAVKPSISAEEWPDDLEENIPDIAHGAIATLCLLPRQDWSNPSLATVQAALFEARMVDVSAKVQKGYGNTYMRGRAEFF